MSVIEVRDLHKTYLTPFRRRRVEAVRGVSLSVEKGEAYGFVGPNGAGKTTTIRVLMGLISPTAGEAKLFGEGVGEASARARIGFLPESPYFYDYLTVSELVDLGGRLFGLDWSTRKKRGAELIDMVGLSHARNTPLKKYSKGMLQRAGLAQALINDPDLVIFDEPMSGLDPIGRKEVRDIIHNLTERGKTVFFSSHILSDVESICDRVAIVVQGRIGSVGRMDELVHKNVTYTELVVRSDNVEGVESILPEGASIARTRDRESVVHCQTGVDMGALVARASDAGYVVVSLSPHYETLEDVFIRSAQEGEGEDA